MNLQHEFVKDNNVNKYLNSTITKALLILSLLVNLKYAYSIYKANNCDKPKDPSSIGRIERLKLFPAIDTAYVGDSHFAFLPFDNYGIGSLRASELKQVPIKANMTYLMIGINDILTNSDPVKDIDTIISRLSNYKVYSIMKVNKMFYDSDRINKEVDRVNAHLGKYNFVKLPFADSLPIEYTSDYLHLNHKGYEVLKEYL